MRDGSQIGDTFGFVRMVDYVEMTVARRFRIWGRVQGVGYRGFVWRTASELGLTGWVRNRVDGTVELVACGPQEVVDALAARLGDGPRFARVDRVEAMTEAAESVTETGFMVHPTS